MVAPAVSTEESWVMHTLKLGIKAVGVGVAGSKPIADDLAVDLIKIIKAASTPGAPADWSSEEELIRQRLASFLGTLFVKVKLSGGDLAVLKAVATAAGDVTSSPSDLVREGCSSAQVLVVAAGSEGSEGLRAYATRLLNAETLSAEEAEGLGTCLFDAALPARLQVMCAHILRVRYETKEEWVGLLRAQQATLVHADVNKGKEREWRVVQIAEPFDGTHKAESLAPLLAWHLQDKWGLIAVSQMGASSGPKYGPNLFDIAHALDARGAVTLQQGCAIGESLSAKARGGGSPRFGYYVDQAKASPALDRWAGIRRNVLKRPFLATAEKFVDTHQARVVIASAFHPSFSDKMFDMVQGATAFDACIILRRGCEGSLGLSLARAGEFTCGVRQADGTLKRLDFKYGPSDCGMSTRPETEQQPLIGMGSGQEGALFTADRTMSYADTGTSGDAVFDERVTLTLKAFDVALEYVLNGRLVGPAAAQNSAEVAAFDGAVNTWGDSASR